MVADGKLVSDSEGDVDDSIPKFRLDDSRDTEDELLESTSVMEIEVHADSDVDFGDE